VKQNGFSVAGLGAVMLTVAVTAPPAAFAQVTSSPARDQPNQADTPPLAGNAANQPNGQVAPPSRIRSDVQVMSPGTGEAPRESSRQITTVPSLNTLSGDRAKGVPER
jgi:hypothetical protein